MSNTSRRRSQSWPLAFIPCPYVYEPLESDRHIRLLRLSSKQRTPAHGDTSSSGLIESIHHFCLDDPKLPIYEPVSYAWAGFQPHLDGPWHDSSSKNVEPTYMYTDAGRLDQLSNLGTCKTLLVSKSLLIALPYLHELSETRWLWIDQLCIDQASSDEQSQPVSIMHEVYGKGSKTLIWLGENTGDVEFLRGVFNKMTLPQETEKTWQLHIPDYQMFLLLRRTIDFRTTLSCWLELT